MREITQRLLWNNSLSRTAKDCSRTARAFIQKRIDENRELITVLTEEATMSKS